MQKVGSFWHGHHGELIEWCYDYDERATYIRTQKPEHERETRLRLFQPVKGDLPQEVVKAGQALNEARQACDETWQVFNKAEQARNKAWQVYVEARQARNKAWQVYVEARQACNEARQARNKARQVCNEARQVCNEARQVYYEAVRKSLSAIEVLHKEECPNCPWNGYTIFPSAA